MKYFLLLLEAKRPNASELASNIIHLNNSLCLLCLWASSFWNTRTHIPYRFFVNQADGGTIKIDLHSNATCSVSNIKSSPRRWDRQWSRSCTSSTSSSFPLSGSMGLPFYPLWRTDRHWPELDWQPVDASLPTTHTPQHALVWVSVIAPVVVHCRLHSTIHTNHSALKRPILTLSL